MHCCLFAIEPQEISALKWSFSQEIKELSIGNGSFRYMNCENYKTLGKKRGINKIYTKMYFLQKFFFDYSTKMQATPLSSNYGLPALPIICRMSVTGMSTYLFYFGSKYSVPLIITKRAGKLTPQANVLVATATYIF